MTNQFQPPLQGIIAAAVTPFRSDLQVDEEAIAQITDRLIQLRIAGLYVCGSTGEGVSLSTEERQRVTEAYVTAVRGRCPVIVQVGHNSYVEACRLARHAQEVGADVFSATCPSYFKVASTDALMKFVTPIAESAELPFYYYHIPSLTGSSFALREFLLQAIQQLPNFVGVKYSSPQVFEFQSCQNCAHRQLDVVWGCDEMLLAAVASGARAAIGSTYNLAAPLYQRILDAVDAGNFGLARRLQLHSVRLVETLEPFGFHAALKATMEMVGLPAGPCRTPLPNLSTGQRDQLRGQLDTIGFFDWCGMMD